MSDGSSDPILYQVLPGYPIAALDLITAAQGRVAGLADAIRGGDPEAQIALYDLTRGNKTLAAASFRATRSHGREGER